MISSKWETKTWNVKIVGKMVEKNAFDGIDFECLETYFKTKISRLKNFSRYKIFPGT